MKIVFDKRVFLFQLFPKLEDEETRIMKCLKEYYLVGFANPEAGIEREDIIIDVDANSIERNQTIHYKLIKSLKEGSHKTDEKLELELVEPNPHVADFHWIFGQIYFERVRSKKEMNENIQTPCWGPQNGYALILMGNLHTVHKNHVTYAMVVHNKALEGKQADYTGLGDIGAIMVKK